MKYNLFLFLVFVLLFSSCKKREWNNPFDPDCPKELFTPSDFKAVQAGNQINLSWEQVNANISGFVIERSIAGGSWVSVATPDKSTTNWADSNVIAGKVHEYHLVAKAGSNISNQLSAQLTPLFASSVTTNQINKLLSTSAILGGNIVSDGGAIVTARGVCWSTSSIPTISNPKTSDGTGTGTFTSTISGLTANTTYYVRAYATNSVGTTYGTEISFKTFYAEVSDIDGNVYPTVKIGNQIWMAENLKTTKYNDGTPIPNVTDNTTWAGLTTGAYCWYNNDATTYKIPYGALYNWYAVNTNKLAPVGWHVATDADWTILTNFLGGLNVAGGKLKETSTNHWLNPNAGATNETGFAALPGGDRYSSISFRLIGQYGQWWTSTEYAAQTQQTAYLREIFNTDAGMSKSGGDKAVGLSIRCLLGTLTPPTISTIASTILTTSSATSGGIITSDGGSAIAARGVCWNTAPNPTIANSKTSDGNGSGSFTSKLTTLNTNATYYARAYATNDIGTSYGNEVSFTLYMNIPGPSVTDFEGNVYKTVKIGNQIWMAENLKTTKYNDGTSIPNITNNTAWPALTTGAYYWYNNDAPGYKNTYGALYNWYALNTGSNGNKRICPVGWHIPTTGEYYQLFDYLGGSTIVGGKLKEVGLTHWISPNAGATNESGFNAIPLMPDKSSCIMWTIEGTDTGIGWYLYLNSADSKAGIFGNSKWLGYSVRCIKD